MPGEALGINKRVELAEVDAILRERKRRELMLAGVTIEKPGDRDHRCGRAHRHGHGDRAVRADSGQDHDRRGLPHRRLLDHRRFELADGVEIGPFTIVDASRLERGAQAGPFARLRMENVVEEGAHIGNFVELKKTRLGAGAKANHLAYLGDSRDRRRGRTSAPAPSPATTTASASTRRPSATGAFVGSNSTLVAPHRDRRGRLRRGGFGDHRAVPPDALALGRARQVVKEGWARKRRERRG